MLSNLPSTLKDKPEIVPVNVFPSLRVFAIGDFQDSDLKQHLHHLNRFLGISIRFTKHTGLLARTQALRNR